MSERKVQSFEQSMGRLNEIVNSMSGNQTSLEDSLALFAEGIRLVSSCKKKLTEAEQKVQMLINQPNGIDSLQDVVLENNRVNPVVHSQYVNEVSSDSTHQIQPAELSDEDDIPF